MPPKGSEGERGSRSEAGARQWAKELHDEVAQEAARETAEQQPGIIKKSLEALKAELKAVQEALTGHREAFKKEAETYSEYKKQGNERAALLGEKITMERLDQISELAQQERALKEQIEGPAA